MHWCALALLISGVLPRSLNAQDNLPGTVGDCCEGDVIIVLDASSSVAAYEFANMVHFLSDLMRPFLLSRGRVRVGLLQVGTEPRVEFGLDTHSSQAGLERAIRRTQQLQGDTNTASALRLAQTMLGVRPGAGGGGGGGGGPPKVLLWLTDGVEPGPIDEPMEELRQAGVTVMALSTGSGNYQVLRRVVSPPIEDHLHFVDVDDISIITEDLRNAIIEVIRADRLQVRDVTKTTAVLQWRPVLTAGTGTYELHYRPTAGGQRPIRQTLRGDSSQLQLTNLRPGTEYTASLTPETNQQPLKTLSVSFTTLSDVPVVQFRNPTTVSISDSGSDRVRVSWGPVHPSRVRRYQVEYAVLPRGQVQTVVLRNHENTTLLTQLQPNSQYLVTVSAQLLNGQESAMSVKACTQEVLLPLEDLRLKPTGGDSVKVEWRGRADRVEGYWVSWDKTASSSSGYRYSSSSSSSSSQYLPPSSVSTFLTNLAPNSRVCVSPVYKTARGEGLCCTHRH